VSSGVALAGTQSLAVDLIGAQLVGLDWRTIGYLWYLSQLQDLRPEDIQVVGENVSECITRYETHEALSWQLGWWVEAIPGWRLPGGQGWPPSLITGGQKMNWSDQIDFMAPSQLSFGVGSVNMAPSQLSFGVDSVNKVGEIAKGLGSEAPLIITDPIVYELGLTRKAEESLHEAGLRVEVFSQVATEPTLAAVESAVETFLSHNCDLLVALGGGSAIDSTKSVSLLLGNEGKLTEYQQLRIGSDWSPARKIERRGAHIIAIPTTAGTDSEVTSGSGVFDPESGIKGWAGNPLLRPTVAICGPALSVSMPPKVTSDTGVDALSQAIECYLVNR